MKGSTQRMKQLNTRLQRTNIRGAMQVNNPPNTDSTATGEAEQTPANGNGEAAAANGTLKPLMSDGSTASQAAAAPQSLKQFMSQPFKYK